MFTIKLKSREKNQLIDITDQIQKLAREQGQDQAACLVFVPHTTAGVTINENADPDVKRDLIMGLNQLIPDTMDFRHREGNSDAHIKASLIGSSVTIPLKDGRLMLGTWQGIFFAEFDGPRNRSIVVSFF
ncbi:MAG: secondary thiamine-phosphate synthase enzyme YjbQ [Syntrophomonadaceae bacterium]|nr:YjbQ family protein [Syntrophomonadaceae bacterium]